MCVRRGEQTNTQGYRARVEGPSSTNINIRTGGGRGVQTEVMSDH